MHALKKFGMWLGAILSPACLIAFIGLRDQEVPMLICFAGGVLGAVAFICFGSEVAPWPKLRAACNRAVRILDALMNWD